MVKTKIENETDRERFKRLGADRAKKVIEKIRILGHCANSSLYDYDERDVRKIFSAIEKELKIVKTKFEKPGNTELNL